MPSEKSERAIPFGALMSFTFILLVAPQTYFPPLGAVRIALLAALVASTAYLLDRLRNGQPITILPREMRITAGLVGWAVLTVPLSYWPGGSVNLLTSMYFKALIIFWLLSNVVNTPARLRKVAWELSLCVVPLAITAVQNFRLGAFFSGGGVKRISGYDAPLTSNPNDLALMLNLILPLTVALFLLTERAAVRILLLGIIVMEVMAVIITFSRAGLLTLAMTFVVYQRKLWRRGERGWIAATLVIVLAAAPLLPAGYFDRLSTIFNLESDPTGSAQARRDDTLAAIRFVLRNPIIGAGIGANILALNQERGAKWTEIHNVYLEYAVELGLPGLALFLLLLVGCIKSVIWVQRECAGVSGLKELFHLAEGIQISLMAFAIAGLFHPVAYHFYFYYIAGLALATKALCETSLATLPPESAVERSDPGHASGATADSSLRSA